MHPPTMCAAVYPSSTMFYPLDAKSKAKSQVEYRGFPVYCKGVLVRGSLKLRALQSHMARRQSSQQWCQAPKSALHSPTHLVLMSATTFGRTAMNSRMVGSLIAAQSHRTCGLKALSTSTFGHPARTMSTAATRTRTAVGVLSRAAAGAWQAGVCQQAGASQCRARRVLSTSTTTDDVMYLPMPKLSPSMVSDYR